MFLVKRTIPLGQREHFNQVRPFKESHFLVMIPWFHDGCNSSKLVGCKVGVGWKWKSPHGEPKINL
jgi:hypothetical protein